MIQTVFKQVFGAAGSQNGALANQDLNGLLVTSTVAFTANDFISVFLKSSKHQAEPLVNRVSLLALAGLSDAEYGQSPALQAQLAAIVGTITVSAGTFVAGATAVTGSGTATVGGTTTDFIGHACIIPLGILKMRANDSSLEILLEMSAACTVSVSAFYNENGEDYAVKTLETRTLSDRMDDVDTVWLYNTTAVNDPSAVDLSVLIKSAYGSTVCNAMDAFGFTAGFKKIEAWAPKNVVCVFDSADNVHDAVSWTISGNDASSYRIISRSIWRDPNRIERGRIQEASRFEGVLAKKDGARRLALARSGIISSEDLVAARRSFANVEG